MERSRLFREAAARHNENRCRKGWRYPPEVRGLAVEYFREQREVGRPEMEIADELGVARASLARWLKERRATGRSEVEVAGESRVARASLVHESTEIPAVSGPFVAVEIHEPAPVSDAASGLRVVTPRGLRLEGLAWSQALELVRAFG